MRKFLLVVLALIAGAVIGYAASIAYYVAYMEWSGGHDQDGGGAMAFAFFIGPVVAVVTGVIAAVWAAVRIR